MLAVALMAVTALGLIAGQLWTAREARAMAMREQAAWIADSVAEAMRTPASADARRVGNGTRVQLRFCRMARRPSVESAGVGRRARDVDIRPGHAGQWAMSSTNQSLAAAWMFPTGTSCVALAFTK